MLNAGEIVVQDGLCSFFIKFLRDGSKSDEFSEIFQTAFNPPSPLIFGKSYCNFLWQIWLHICKEVWWPDSMKCMHMISRDRDHSEGWGVGVNCRLEPFWKFIRFGNVTRPLEKFYKEALHQFIRISCHQSWRYHFTLNLITSKVSRVR